MCLLFYPPSYNAQIMYWTSSVIFLIYESPSPFSRSTLVWTLATPTELSCISLHQVTTYKERNFTTEREMSIFHFPFLRGNDGYNDLEYTELQVDIKLMIFQIYIPITTKAPCVHAIATCLLSDCNSNWVSCPFSGLMMIYISLNIVYYWFL